VDIEKPFRDSTSESHDLKDQMLVMWKRRGRHKSECGYHKHNLRGNASRYKLKLL
jgi:hypothetical protein